MIVVFDTNIWYSQLGLKSPAAAAVRFYLRHHGARVAIPEVIRLEVTHNLTNRLLKHITTIQGEYRQLLTAFGKLREVILPTESDVSARVEELLGSLGVEILDIPFSLPSARSSFIKVIKKLPPSQGSQQFKDGVLWADCLDLLSVDDVVLVSDDKAFYEEQKPERGVARVLLEEAAGRSHGIRVLPGVADLLDAIRVPVAIEMDDLQQAFLAQHGSSVFGTLERLGFDLGVRTEATMAPFATEDPAAIFLEFAMKFVLSDTSSAQRTNATLHLRGDCSFAPEQRRFEHMRNFGEHLEFTLPDGTVEERRNQVLFLDSIVMGHRIILDATRYRLSGST